MDKDPMGEISHLLRLPALYMSFFSWIAALLQYLWECG